MGRPRTLWLVTAGLTSLAALAACSSSSSGGSANTSGNSNSSSKAPYTIGVTIPLTGSAASFGVVSSGGMNIAAAEINAAGGIDGHKLVLKYEDDQLVPATAVTDMQDLASSNVSLVLTGGSSIVRAELPVATKHNMLLVNVAAQDDTFLTDSHYFTFIPTNNEELGQLASLVYKTKHLSKVAVIHSNDAYGASAAAAFISNYKALGGTVTEEEEHDEGTTNYSTYLLKIRASNPQGMVILSNTGEIGHIIAQSRQLGLSVPLFAADSALSPGDIQTAGSAMDGVEGVAVKFQPGSSTAATKFSDTFKANNKGIAPNSYSAISYIAVNELAAAMKTTGGDDPVKIAAYLKGIKSVSTILGEATPVPGKPVITYPIYEWLYSGGAVTQLNS